MKKLSIWGRVVDNLLQLTKAGSEEQTIIILLLIDKYNV